MRRAYSLLEVLLVLVLMVVLSSMVMLSMGLADADNLVNSAKDFRSLMVMARAMAMSDGKIYRIRLDDELREEFLDDDSIKIYQPIVERQIDPIAEPYEYEIVTEQWATDVILQKGVRAYAVKFGEPTFEDTTGENLEAERDDEYEPAPEDLAPIVFTPDGKSEWLTIWLTTAPDDEMPDDPEYERLSLVMDGRTSQIFIQQPLNDEEIDLLQSYNLAPLIRADRVNKPRLTEANILKLDRKP